MDAITQAETRAREDRGFATLLAEMVASLEHRGDFDLGRLYETTYNDFEVLLGVLYLWRLQRFNGDIFAELRDGRGGGCAEPD
jgi:hypothetical protein